MSKRTSSRRAPAVQPLRFAHPFFTPSTPAARAAHPVHGVRMLDHVVSTLGPVPATKGNGRFTLADVIGQPGTAAIEQSGRITFHLAGDTGVPELDHETRQTMVAEAMALDYQVNKPHLSPACFVHLGDVIYGAAADGYLSQFFRPYMHYPGKIIAIPGNHDGESAVKLKAFRQIFCAAKQVVPKIAGSIFRETMTQPGVYWCLDAPFTQIIGLYANNAENPGSLVGGAGGPAQKAWLIRTLKAIKQERAAGTRKALFFTTHHPPYSSGGHSGSAQMLADIDDACQQAGIMPDVHFSGHAHSIQRYARNVTFGGKVRTIPYIVTGCGGHGGQVVAKLENKPGANPVYAFGYKGWGFTSAEVRAGKVVISSFGVENAKRTLIDTLTVPLA